MKIAAFLSDARAVIRAWPTSAKKDVGEQINRVQNGLDPKNWKPMRSIGPGVREIRIQDETGAYRVIYVASFADAVYVLHAFQKKTQATPKRDIDLAARRLAILKEQLK